ncbi:MAG: IS66 family transposase, partial [Chlamydiae bacterium]|nr:IS66 family transposase [Chlamydiota bacterium]
TENVALKNENATLKEKNEELNTRLDWLLRQIFGKKSEKIIDLSEEHPTFKGFEALFPSQAVESQKTEDTEVESKRRQINRTGENKITFPDDLPKQVVVIDLPEEEKICKDTGVLLKQIGQVVSSKLAYAPGSYYIKEIIRLKYAHPTQEERGVFCSEMPPSIFPKCTVDDSFLADIVVKKYADHLPLHRISEILARDGVGINRQLLSQWVIHCGEAVVPLYNEMIKRILSSTNVFIDESPIKVQTSNGVENGFMWVLVGGDGPTPPYRIYNFRPDRAHKNAFDLLEGYAGHVHSDKYGAYESLSKKPEIIWTPCWVHIRRRFFEAQAGDPEFRRWVLRKIRYLYMFEKIAWRRSPEERLKIRQEKESPIIDEIIEKIKERASKGDLLPKSQIMKAMNYFIDLIPHVKNYTKHAFAHIDNNVAERAVRPLAIGRKNWLFFGSHDAGQVSAILFSLVQTCRGLGVNPREYLEDVFRRLQDHTANKLYELLPDHWAQARKNPQ